MGKSLTNPSIFYYFTYKFFFLYNASSEAGAWVLITTCHQNLDSSIQPGGWKMLGHISVTRDTKPTLEVLHFFFFLRKNMNKSEI